MAAEVSERFVTPTFARSPKENPAPTICRKPKTRRAVAQRRSRRVATADFIRLNEYGQTKKFHEGQHPPVFRIAAALSASASISGTSWKQLLRHFMRSR